jgi:hypothetical protein
MRWICEEKILNRIVIWYILYIWMERACTWYIWYICMLHIHLRSNRSLVGRSKEVTALRISGSFCYAELCPATNKASCRPPSSIDRAMSQTATTSPREKARHTLLFLAHTSLNHHEDYIGIAISRNPWRRWVGSVHGTKYIVSLCKRLIVAYLPAVVSW